MALKILSVALILLSVHQIQAQESCFLWNDKWWIGTEPSDPVYTECGIDECILCSCFEWNQQSWIGYSPSDPVYTVCGLDSCIECPY